MYPRTPDATFYKILFGKDLPEPTPDQIRQWQIDEVVQSIKREKMQYDMEQAMAKAGINAGFNPATNTFTIEDDAVPNKSE